MRVNQENVEMKPCVSDWSNTTPIFSVTHLNLTLIKGRERTPILEDVSFDIRQGECLGILGESGSGKSMTIKAALGLLDHQFEIKGEATFAGESLITMSADARRQLRGGRITMVLQNPMTAFDPLYKMGEQMAQTFEVHTNWSAAEIRDESIALLKAMRIHDPEEVLKKYPHQLSGGMLQRVMIGLAVKLKPELIICDEPTTAIDSISRHAIMHTFLEIKRRLGVAMIFISHDLGVLNMLADRMVVMKSGRVVESGTPDHVLKNATDPYTRLLIDKHCAVTQAFKAAVTANTMATTTSPFETEKDDRHAP